MAEEWKLERLERKIDLLREQFRDAERRSQEEKRERADRINSWFYRIVWTIYVVALTTMIVLAATGDLHHH